jgi:hypothetical protein
MAKRKKPKPLRAVKMVKELARERIGAPPVERVVPDRKKKRRESSKHKPTLAKMLEGGSSFEG